MSTLAGEPSITEGTLTVTADVTGGLMLTVSCGDENWPDNIEVQFPLTAAEATAMRDALST